MNSLANVRNGSKADSNLGVRNGWKEDIAVLRGGCGLSVMEAHVRVRSIKLAKSPACTSKLLHSAEKVTLKLSASAIPLRPSLGPFEFFSVEMAVAAI